MCVTLKPGCVSRVSFFVGNLIAENYRIRYRKTKQKKV